MKELEPEVRLLIGETYPIRGLCEDRPVLMVYIGKLVSRNFTKPDELFLFQSKHGRFFGVEPEASISGESHHSITIRLISTHAGDSVSELKPMGMKPSAPVWDLCR